MSTVRRRRVRSTGRWCVTGTRYRGTLGHRLLAVLGLATVLLVASFGAVANASSMSGVVPVGGHLALAVPSSLGAGARTAPATRGAWLDWGDHDHARVEAVAAPLEGTGPSLYGNPPSWLGYDSLHRQFYVPEAPSSVDIVPGNFTSLYSGLPTVSAVIPVGTNPFGVAFDSASGEIFVTNSGSDNVSVLDGNDSAPVATVSVGASPAGIAYDPTTGDLYVANNGSDNVSVISGSSLQVVASVDVGANPVGVAADPISGQVFVADAGDSNVTIFNASSYGVITNVTVGSVPYGIAIDPVSDTAYVTNSASVNVTVLSASTDSIVAWITVPGGLTYPPNDLSGLAYDSQDGLVFVGAGYHDMLVLNTSTLSVEAVLGTDPAGVVYNPDTGDVCVTNTDNNTFECLLTEVSFTETGLSSGAEWTVNVTPSIAGPPSTSNVLDFQVPIFTSFNYTVLATGGNEPTPASGTEIGLDQWQSQEISISFSPGATSYWANFTESGLPSGGGWSVDLDGLRDSGTLATIGFLVPNGTYPFYVANTLVNGTQYTPSLSSGTVYVNGSDFLVGFTFQTSTPTPADYPVTFQESGLPNGTAWSGSVGSWVFLNQTVPTATLGLPNGTYAFTIGNVSGFSASPSSGSLTVDGASVTENITFTSTAVVPRYLVGFQEYGLPAGTSWNATLGGMTRNSTGLWINFTASNGTYTFDVPAVTGYAANSSAGNLTVQGRSVTVTLTFSPVPFPVEFTESGLAAGSNWTVVATNRANDASVTGTRSTATITLSLVEGTYAVTATGPAGPHPSMYSTSLVVGSDGAGPVMILLGPVVCACGEVGVPGPPLQLYLLVGAIVAVGAVVAGMILVRTRRPPPEPPLDPTPVRP
jgi:YVTN family beta-propeller protein